MMNDWPRKVMGIGFRLTQHQQRRVELKCFASEVVGGSGVKNL